MAMPPGPASGRRSRAWPCSCSQCRNLSVRVGANQFAGQVRDRGAELVSDHLLGRELAREAEPAARQQDRALAGAKGAGLLAVSTVDGSAIAEQSLAASPVWDGMASELWPAVPGHQKKARSCVSAPPTEVGMGIICKVKRPPRLPGDGARSR